jgi:hypothetical protein
MASGTQCKRVALACSEAAAALTDGDESIGFVIVVTAIDNSEGAEHDHLIVMSTFSDDDVARVLDTAAAVKRGIAGTFVERMPSAPKEEM